MRASSDARGTVTVVLTRIDAIRLMLAVREAGLHLRDPAAFQELAEALGGATGLTLSGTVKRAAP